MSHEVYEVNLKSSSNSRFRETQENKCPIHDKTMCKLCMDDDNLYCEECLACELLSACSIDYWEDEDLN
jgi:hypothetical protein